MFSPKKYHEYLQSQPTCFLYAAVAKHRQRQGEINEKDYEAYMDYIRSMYFTKTEPDPEVTEYLQTLKERATPEACRQAKKGLLSYCEYLIHQDKKSGTISHEIAKEAKLLLSNFLTQNKTDDKQV
ncbi:MAG: hypothetical protein EOO10_15430 [Chitinophagaceae bacterium]|nr:MAG: hypothetical protein EOO10_15430 [Chitinophagaceae bacterium]